jgi:hypothetical protein
MSSRSRFSGLSQALINVKLPVDTGLHAVHIEPDFVATVLQSPLQQLGKVCVTVMTVAQENASHVYCPGSA